MTLKLKLLYVQWMDAQHDGSWSDHRDEVNYKLAIIHSIGWLIHKNKEFITLAATLDPVDAQVANKQYIPIKMIKYQKEVKRRKLRS